MEQYEKIQQLLKKEPGTKERVPIFPPTVIQAVFDAKTGASLEAILAQFNSVFVQYQGTAKDTRMLIPADMRRPGLIITYINAEGETITERATLHGETDDEHWSIDTNWSRIDELSLCGDIAVSARGTWIINGEDTGIKAVGPKGENGITPWLKEIDNKLHYSYDNVKWTPCSDPLSAQFRNHNNRIQISYDKGKTWTDISDPVATYVRFAATSSTSQDGSIGKLQYSYDKATWHDLSPEFRNYLRIQGYVSTHGKLPTGVPVGTIYGVGPFYEIGDINNTNPMYQLQVWDGTQWVHNGRFNSIAAGIVQETGYSETEVMSQKAVTKSLLEIISKYEKDYTPALVVSNADMGSKTYNFYLLKGNTYILTNKSSATLTLSNRNPENVDENYDDFGNCVANMQKELIPTKDGVLSVYANGINSFEIECINSIYYKLMQTIKDVGNNTININKCLREGVNVTTDTILSDADNAQINLIYLLSFPIANTPEDYGILYSVCYGSSNYIVQYFLSPNSDFYYRVKWREWGVWKKCNTNNVELPIYTTYAETGVFVGELNEGKNAQVSGTKVYVAGGSIGSHSCLIAEVQGGSTLKVYCSWTGSQNYGCGWIATDINGNVVDRYYGTNVGSGFVFANLPENAKTIYINGLDGLIPSAEKTNAIKHLNCYTKEEADSKFGTVESDLSLSAFRKVGIVGDSYASGEVYWKEGSEWKSKDKYSISWGQILARKHGFVCTNYTQGGLNTRTWLYSSTPTGLTKMLNSEADDLYLLALGINDYYGLGESYLGTIEDIINYTSYSDYGDTFYGNYGRIIEHIKEHAPYSKIVIFTCANESEIAHKFNEAIIKIATHYNIPYIVQRDDKFFSSDIYNDMVQGHPRGVSYSGMANAFDRLLNDCFSKNYSYFKDLYMNSDD